MPIANFHSEYEAFQAFVHPESSERILIFRGESGSGKTTLVKRCLGALPKSSHCVPIQLRASAVTIAEVFSRSATILGQGRFSRFGKELEALQGSSEIRVAKNQLIGFNNRITVAMQSEDTIEREYRRSTLTDAWFDDIKASSSQVLIALDTYEHATMELREWIEGPFLSRVAQVGQIRALVAGQAVPDHNNIEWGGFSSSYSLLGVFRAEEWMPVVTQLSRRIPAADPLSWLKGVCDALGGRPKDIMQVIEGLPILEASR